jgi:hypothetical protein
VNDQLRYSNHIHAIKQVETQQQSKVILTPEHMGRFNDFVSNVAASPAPLPHM